MAVNPKSPGVYIDEIPTLPASIAEVATAIPAFIGYVEKAESNGLPILLNTPVRITSLLEYETTFGKGQSQAFSIGINDITTVAPTQRTITVTKLSNSSFRLYYNLQMYFANGGGPCYIVPIGFYDSPSGISTPDFITGLAAISKVDEPTLLLTPDALALTPVANIKTVYDTALAQCQKLKDRFVIMDLTQSGTIATDASNFRTSLTGPDNLKYGAAYYPDLNSSLNYFIDLNQVFITSHTTGVIPVPITDSVVVIDFVTPVNQAVITAKRALAVAKMAALTLTQSDATLAASLAANAKTAAANAETKGALIPVLLTQFIPAKAASVLANTQATAVVSAANAFAAPSGQTAANAAALITAIDNLINKTTTTLTLMNIGLSSPLTLFIAGSLAYLQINNPAVYSNIIAQINSYFVTINPSGAMAGIYARVDAERGVWKAPANVGVRNIIGPSINITTSEQDGLNIDATSGKSINALRAFTGKGTLVWGARTLAGNDNEWRYINVRRLFNFVEESIAEATEFVVFEPNDANTWQRMNGMITAFLTTVWRNGALAGATPKDAFFVRVGLGTTMTAQDILEGRMIIEIGLAAVRPAEFIILKFMHKLQES